MELSKRKNYKAEQVDTLNYDLSVDNQSTHYQQRKRTKICKVSDITKKNNLIGRVLVPKETAGLHRLASETLL